MAKTQKSIYKLEDVQEIGKTRPAQVPHRFIRPHEERPEISQTNSQDLEIPLIDMAKIMGSSSFAGKQLEMSKLDYACKEWGFFQVINHGVEHNVIEKAKEVGRGFFSLGVEEREVVAMEEGSIQGYGQAFVFSEDQKLDWCDMLALGTMPKCLRMDKFWPKNPKDFKQCIEDYSLHMSMLGKKILKAVSQNLGMKNDDLNKAMGGEHVQAVRMNYYPPCPRPDLVLGMSSHSDGSAITILSEDTSKQGNGKQDCDIGMLQVLHSGKWVEAKAKGSSGLIVNVGDSLEVMSNGRYVSCEHRTLVSSTCSRLSLATFHAPSYEVNVGPLPSLVDEHHPPVFRTYSHSEYNRHYLSHKLHGKHALDFARIQLTPQRP